MADEAFGHMAEMTGGNDHVAASVAIYHAQVASIDGVDEAFCFEFEMMDGSVQQVFIPEASAVVIARNLLDAYWNFKVLPELQGGG